MTATIDTTVDDLLATEHAVMLYDNDEDMQAIACGNIGGAMLDDTLVAGLGESASRGMSALPYFKPDGDKTDVTILIGHAMAPVSASVGMASSDRRRPTMQNESEDHSHADMGTPAA